MVTEKVPLPAFFNTAVVVSAPTDSVEILNDDLTPDFLQGDFNEPKKTKTEHHTTFALPKNILSALFVPWLIGAMSIGLWEIRKYCRFRKTVLTLCEEDKSTETADIMTDCMMRVGLKQRPLVKICPQACPPFVTGLFRPIIVLPDGILSREELGYTLLHETIHLKNRDLWIRFLALIVKVLHWYNPLTWLLSRLLVEWSELTCDETLTAPLTAGECHTYGYVILKAASIYWRGMEEWAAGLSSLKIMKRRLYHMLKFKKMSPIAKIVAPLTMTAVLLCGVVMARAVQLPVSEDQNVQVGNAGVVDQETDLNHNGKLETLQKNTDGVTEEGNSQVTVTEGNEVIFTEASNTIHAEWEGLFLCRRAGQDYLLRYTPAMYQGAASYSYQLFYLSEDGSEVVTQKNRVDFNISFGSPLENFNPKTINAFLTEVNDLLSDSIQLINTDDDLIHAFAREGRLYHIPDFLYAGDENFTYDESKSILENLEAYNSVMKSDRE